MSHIRMTNGWPSFKEWVDAGYPGAVNGEKKTQLAKCRVHGCANAMNTGGYCLAHYRILQRAKSA